jgi:hypothetical protein
MVVSASERGIELDPGDAVVSTLEHTGMIYVFTAQGHVYQMTGNPLVLHKLFTPAGATGSSNVWRAFVPDPGWVNSTLRYRLVHTGLQIEGGVSAPLPADNLARIGIIPEGFRPARQQWVPIVCGELSLANAGFALLRIDPDGAVWTRWSIANGSMAVSAIIALD